MRNSRKNCLSIHTKTGLLALLLSTNLILPGTAAAAECSITITNDTDLTQSPGADHIYDTCNIVGGSQPNDKYTVTIGNDTTPFTQQYVQFNNSYYYSIVGGMDAGTGHTVILQNDATHVNSIMGSNNNGDSNDNTVLIKAGTVDSDVYGGYSWNGSGGSSNHNYIEISGGRIKYNVWGGYSWSQTESSNNIVTYTGGSIQGTIYGGNCSSAIGNTLNIKGSNLSANNIMNFQNLNFYIPADVVNSSQAILTLTDTTASTNLDNMQIKAGIMSGSSLQTGDTITLLQKTGSGNITDLNTTYGTLTQGVSLEYTLSISKSPDNKSLIATLQNPSLAADTKSLVETQAAAAALVNSGADMLISGGFAQAELAAAQPDSAAPAGSATGNQTAAPAAGGFAPFAAMGSQNMRYHTGSYVDNTGWGISAGFARKITNQQGELLFGPIIEYGHSDYDSYLDDGTHGSGGSHYTGGGLFARETTPSGRYYEGSLRAGRIASDYSSTNMTGASSVSYETSAPYYGLHLGLGKVTDIGRGNSIDTYGRYFYSHQNGSSADLSTGEHYDFSSVDSHRLRLGARYTHRLNPASSLYAGLAYQYEFGGDAKATYQGDSTPSPSLKGGSGMLELGWQIKPDKLSPVTLDLSMTGWTGKQEGVNFNLGANWTF